MSEDFYMVEYVGGPLDGWNLSHPMANYIQIVEGHPEGRYIMFSPYSCPQLADGKYHWVLQEQKSGPPL